MKTHAAKTGKTEARMKPITIFTWGYYGWGASHAQAR
jgi:hypothetical protein